MHTTVSFPPIKVDAIENLNNFGFGEFYYSDF